MNSNQPSKASEPSFYFVLQDGRLQEKSCLVAAEKPIAISYNGTSHAVMMATPADFEDFAIGFSLTEGLISSRKDVENISVLELENGYDIQIQLNQSHREAFQKRRRHMAGPVGCGLCGIESIDAAMRDLPQITENNKLSMTKIIKAVENLKSQQILNQKTHTTHAAAFYRSHHDKEFGLVAIREDVGRHNALDKLCGALINTEETVSNGAVIVTSRLSVEMVQKTVMMGASALIAISAPTAEAIRIGREANLTLIARMRGNQYEIYSGIERVSI